MTELYPEIRKNQAPRRPLGQKGLPLDSSAGGGWLPACSKFHISQHSPEGNELGRQFLDKSPSYSPASVTARGGSPYAHSGEIYKIDIWRTSARVYRENRKPKYVTKEINLEESGVGPNGLIDFHYRQYARDKGLAVPDWEDIPKIYQGNTRGKIDSFSSKSRANLKRVASNSFPLLISQYCLTYPNTCVPKDGRTAKKQLEKFLRAVKRKFSGSVYLWVLEFQTKRGAPHFHVFFSFPRSDERQIWLTEKWIEIVDPPTSIERVKMFNVHNHDKNFTKWDMKKGGYLSNKYLTKEAQKEVPPDFQNVGRFWGNSRNLVPDPISYFPDHPFAEVTHTDRITGEAFTTDSKKNIYRILRRHHETSIRNAIGKRRRSRITNKALTTVNLPAGGRVVNQYLDWLFREETRHVKDVPF